MRALRFYGVDQPLSLEEVERPQPGPDEVVVRVAGCGVCHTDIGFWKDGVPTRHALPLTLGHEVSGTVVETGKECSSWQGASVIVPAVIPCGSCNPCWSGRGNACPTQIMPGNDIDGGFAEFIRVPERGLCRVSETGDYDLAELSVVADAVTTPYQAVRRSGLGAGDLAIVIGAGGVGGYAVQIAAALGARVVALDIDEEKLELISQHGAVRTFNSRNQDFKTLKNAVKSAAKELECEPQGWKIFECSGTAAGQETALGLMGSLATLMVVGFTLDKVTFRLSNLMAFDATIQGTWGCLPEFYPQALELVTSGRITLKPFITLEPLDKGAEVFRAVASHEVKKRIILVP